MMTGFTQDLRYAVRTLWRNPGFTTVTVLTLALGIGACTAIFGVVYGIVLQPLPFSDSERLVRVVPAQLPGNPDGIVSPDGFLQWQEQNEVFEDLAAFWSRPVTLTGSGDPERLITAAVTLRFFDTLRVATIAGRTFVAGDEQVVVLTEALWRRRFGSDRSVVGKPVMLDGQPVIIVGVMPEGFTFPEDILGRPGFRSLLHVDVWTLFKPEIGDRANAFLKMIGRLKPEITLQQAQANVAITARRAAGPVRRDTSVEATVVPLHEYVVGDVRRLLLLFLGAVGVVLLIACVNVANLLVGRAAARQKEVAIRAALGSTRARLVRQFLTESLVLGLLGGAAGLLIAVWGTDLLVGLIPRGNVPRVGEAGVSLPVLAFTGGLSLVVSLIFGLAPTLHATRTNIELAIREVGRTQTPGVGVMNLFVIAEVALAVVLLTGAGLLIKSFLHLTRIDPGFNAEHILTLSVTLPERVYKTPTALTAFHGQVLERLTKLPGVTSAGAINWLPFGGNLLSGDLIVEGRAPGASAWAAKSAVSTEYFRTMGIPVVRGRSFTAEDTETMPGVVIVTERVARQLWPGQDPIGKRIKLGFGRPAEQPWASVIGVVRDVKHALSDNDVPTVYMPLAQAPRPFLLSEMTFVIRGADDSTSLAPAVRREIQAIDPDLPIYRMARLQDLIALSVSEPRFRSVLLGAFAGSALALVATGILGVLMYSVTRRTREIGIRLALGAQASEVSRLVLGHALRLALAGLTLGVVGALALTRLIRNLLFDVTVTDPAVFLIAGALLVAVAVLASYLPVRRAIRVDPIMTLRSE